jgi:hypothetical protein
MIAKPCSIMVVFSADFDFLGLRQSKVSTGGRQPGWPANVHILRFVVGSMISVCFALVSWGPRLILESGMKGVQISNALSARAWFKFGQTASAWSIPWEICIGQIEYDAQISKAIQDDGRNNNGHSYRDV